MTETEFKYIQYISKFGKSYSDVTEFNMRASLFQKHDAVIEELNTTQTTSVHGHNFLSDWTAAEKTRLLGLANVQKEIVKPSEPAAPLPSIPTEWNWVTAGNYVNPIQDQGNCGSCWAFAAAAAMESAHAIFQGSLYKLSEQNLVSCAGSKWGNYGCNGGDQRNAWNYTKTNPLESEFDYPYTSGTTGKTGSCLYVGSKGIGST